MQSGELYELFSFGQAAGVFGRWNMGMLSVMTATLSATIIDQLTQRPAEGVRFQIYWVEPHADVLLRSGCTNRRGTTDTPLLDPMKMSAGEYRLVLHMGDYFEDAGLARPRAFLDRLPVTFLIEDASKPTHIQISVSPTSYTVERG
jgi:5-hydroxyisourate hydrolase